MIIIDLSHYIARPILLILISAITYYQASGQVTDHADSLKKTLQKEGLSPIGKAEILIELSWIYKDGNTVEAEGFAGEALGIARKNNDKHLLGKALHASGAINTIAGNLDIADRQLKEGLENAEVFSDTTLISGILNSLGNLKHRQSEYESALDYYMRRVHFIKANDLSALAVNYNNIGRIHESIDNNEKAIEYFSKALDIHHMLGNDRLECGTLINLGIAYFNISDFIKALDCYQESLLIASVLEDRIMLSIIYENIGNIYKEQEDYEEARRSFQKALVLSEQLKDDYGVASISRNLGETYLNQQKYDLALPNLLKSQELAESAGGKSFLLNSKRLLAKTYHEMGQFALAYSYLSEYQTLKDTLFNATKNKQIQELQTKYETEKKDSEISILKTEKELQESKLFQARIVRNTSIIIGLLTGLLAFMFVRSNRLKMKAAKEVSQKNEEISKQKLLQLEKDKKLEILHAVITGEENERQRIAKDLHDGLSGMLAAAKMQFDQAANFQKNLTTTDAYNDALQILEEANREVRRVAHNMMPEILVKFGIIEALNSFINNIRSAHNLHIEFIHLGDLDTLSHQAKLSTYRIIQELIHNIVKHSGAKNVLIQLEISEEMLLVTVEDDGVGFDFDEKLSSKGIGISNILSRISYLGGEISFDTTPGKGTSVNFELNLNKQELAI